MPRKKDNNHRGFRPDNIESHVAQADTPLLDFLFASMPDRKRTVVKQFLTHNQVAVNGVPTRQFDFMVTAGSLVEVNLTREFRIFSHRRLKIVYEDDHIIVVNKGYGLLSMATDNDRGAETAYSILRNHLKWLNPANRLYIVHRLDRDTSGLMMFAKSEEAKIAMQHNWNNMVLSREYVCVVEGRPEPPEGTIRNFLAENRQHEMFVTDNEEEGQLAVTRYKTVKSAKGYSLVTVQLDTGRKNQIRVHMASIGCPISGDRRYGGKTSPIYRLALHARTLHFAHPITRKEMRFELPIPNGFLRMVK